MEELQKEESRLCSIGEDGIFSEMQQLEYLWTLTAAEKQAVSTPSVKVSAASGEGEGWKLVTSSIKRSDPAPSKGLQVQNRSTTLIGEEEPDVPSSKGSGPPLACKEEERRCKNGKKVALEIE